MKRFKIWLPLAALTLLCLGWSAFWLVAARKTEATLRDVMAREAEQGRLWSCDALDIGGYPFRIEASCRQLRFSRPLASGTLSVQAPALVALAQVYAPNDVLFEADGPLEAASPTGRLVLNWKNLSGQYRGTLQAFERVNVFIDEAALSVEGGASASLLRLGLHARRSVLEPSDKAVDLAIEAAQVHFAPLDALAGNAEPLDLKWGGALSRADLLLRGGGGLPMRLEAWRVNGGKLATSDLSVSKGPVRINGASLLKLDAERRVEGTVDLRAEGLEPALVRFGVSPKMLNAGSALGALLSGAPKAPKDSAEAKKMILPLRAQDGRVFLGPLPLPVTLSPLY